MTRIWMLCLLTALLHSGAYAAKPTAENAAKAKSVVEAAKIDKIDTARKGSDDDEEKDRPASAPIHSAATTTKPTAENPAKGKSTSPRAKIGKTDTARRGSDDDEEKDPPAPKKKEPNRDR